MKALPGEKGPLSSVTQVRVDRDVHRELLRRLHEAEEASGRRMSLNMVLRDVLGLERARLKSAQ